MPETNVEPVEDFRDRLRTWLKDEMPPAHGLGPGRTQGRLSDEEELAEVTHQRELQTPAVRGRVRGDLLPEGVRRAGPDPCSPGSAQ